MTPLSTGTAGDVETNPGPSGRRSVAKGPTPEEEIQTLQGQVYRLYRDRYTDSTGTGIQTLQGQVYRLYKDRYTDSTGTGIQTIQGQVY